MTHFDQQTRTLARCIAIGVFFVTKYKNQATVTSVTRTARALKKQGVPCEIAIKLLANRGAI